VHVFFTDVWIYIDRDAGAGVKGECIPPTFKMPPLFGG
jgi:hypothetical protein